MDTFDLSKPEARVIKSSMGGGWIIPLTGRCEIFLTDLFQEPAFFLDPVEEKGWIVEPWDSANVAEALREAGIAWAVA